MKRYNAIWTKPCPGSGQAPTIAKQEDLFIKRRKFVGRNLHKQIPFKIPYGAIVQVVKFFKKGRAVIEYDGEKILTMTRLLRKKTT